MKGSRSEQGVLTRDNDRRRTEETRRVVERMVDGLNDHVIDGIGAFFASDFRWLGNAGCGTKNGVREFQDNWQRPFQAAFSDKICVDEARIAEGEWMAAFGRQEATHSGEFMGIAPTGKCVEIRYMDFWKVQNGKIVGNWVMVDFPACHAPARCRSIRRSRMGGVRHGPQGATATEGQGVAPPRSPSEESPSWPHPLMSPARPGSASRQ